MSEPKSADNKGGIRRPRSRENTGGVDWMDADAEKLRSLVAAAAFRGGALRFGYTRDGGAYAVGVYYGNEYWTDYVRPGEDIDTYLDDLTGSFQDADVLPKKDWKKPQGHRRGGQPD